MQTNACKIGEPKHPAENTSPHPQLLDTEQLAAALNLRPRTVDAWRRKGRLPYLKLGAKCVRYRLADVMDALQSRYGMGVRR